MSILACFRNLEEVKNFESGWAEGCSDSALTVRRATGVTLVCGNSQCALKLLLQVSDILILTTVV